MGGRSSKVTVSQTGEGDPAPTDAALLQALASEYASSKHRTGSGRIAWDFNNYAIRSKERDSEEVLLVDGYLESQSQPGTGATSCSAGSSDKKIRAQAQAGTADKVLGSRGAGSNPIVSPHLQSTSAGGDYSKPSAAPSAAAAYQLHNHQSKNPTVEKGCAGQQAPDPASKHKRPATGKPKDPRHKRNGHNPEMPPPPHTSAAAPTPPTAAAAAALAAAVASVAAGGGGAAATAAAAARQNAVPSTPHGPHPTTPVAPPAQASAAQPRPGGAPGAAAAVAAASPDGESGAAGAAVQWVIRPGPPIEGAYKLGNVLGQGSFGVVRAATHLSSGAEVAVKTIRKSLLRSADVAALRREVEILHHLSGHPAISQLLGVYEEARQLHLVLELYKGGDLFDAIIGVGRHSERTAADVMRTVLTAIAYCHAMGVAHRDVKPENFMLTAELPNDFQPEQQPEQQQPTSQPAAQQQPGARNIPLAPPLIGIGARLKLIDFGLSAFCTDDTPLTEIVGTSYYVAPEVLEGRYSLPADVWSAGVILHIMLTGYAPFDGKDDREILRAVRKGKLDLSADPVWKSISAEASAVLLAMLERDPNKRATAEQVLAMPWLGRTAAVCEAPSAPLPGVVSERMHRFARMSSFKKEARRVVAGLMRPEEVAGLVAQFRGLDTDRDGRISLAELREGIARQALLRRGSSGGPPPLSEEQLKELLRRSDLNGDGLLDESEFLGAALPAAALARQALAAAGASRPVSGNSSAARQPNAIAAAFRHFDADGSGFISTEELRRALAAHHPSGKGLDVQALLSRHDRDADGRISYPEFVDMLVQDIDDDDNDMYDTAVIGRTRLGGGGGGGGGGGLGGVRFNAGGNAVASAPKSHDSAGEREPSSSTAAYASASSAARARGSRAVSRSSTAAAQMPSGRMSPLDWSDECMDSEDEAAAAAARLDAGLASFAAGSRAEELTAGMATALAVARSSAGGAAGGGANAARPPSRLSQPQVQVQMQPHPPPYAAVGPDAPSPCAANPRLAAAGRCGSVGINRRGSIGGYSPLSADAADARVAGCGSGGGLNRMAGLQDQSSGGDASLYGTAAAAAAAASGAPRPGTRPPPPPRLQLPSQPAVDARSRRHSAGGGLQYDRAVLAAAGGGGGGCDSGGSGCSSPMHRAAPSSRRCTPGTATEPGPGGFAPAEPLARTAVGVGGCGGAAISLPGSPSAAAAAAAAAHRSVAGRGSTGAPQHQHQQQQQQRSQPLPAPLTLLPALQAPGPCSPSAERLSERASCPQYSLRWPPSPGSGGAATPAAAAAAASPRPNRASVTGMLPVRNVQPWPAASTAAGGGTASPAAGAAAGAGVAAAAVSAATLRAAPPSEPLPVLHSAGLRSRRQSTGSPGWNMHPAAATPATAAIVAAAAAAPGLLSYQSQPLYQLPQPRHNYSVSCSGGGGGYGTCTNALSPRVPPAAATAGEWGSGTSGGGGATAVGMLAGRRSRRATQPGVLQPPSPSPVFPGAEELILTSRASMDLDVAAAAARGFPVSGASGEEEPSLAHVLPPGATGLGFGSSYLPYRHLTTSTSGRLL